MNITTQNIYDLFSPTKCEKRLFYRFNGEKEAEPGPFEELLFKLGQRHEQNHINSLGGYVDLSAMPYDEQIRKTKESINSNVPIIYQGIFESEETINGTQFKIIGMPDIMLHENSSYIIRDCKLARHADEKKHPEILAQLQVYGYLYERNTGIKPTRLEAFLGDSSIIEIPYDDGDSAKQALTELLSIISSSDVPYSPVGWSKCLGCGFRKICWDIAVENDDVALVYGVDQGLARAFEDEGIKTVDHLLEKYDEASLSELKRPWGKSLRKVGKQAPGILIQAKAMQEKTNILLEKIALPDNPNFVMFDIEGLPPYLDELDKIYLWGVQVFGDNQGDYIPAISPIEPDGDQKGWEIFLSNCEKIFDKNGDIPFVHWHHYEKTKMNLYIERYGDRNGVAQRILNNLLDLLPITRNAIALSEPSYSLKIVEKVARFKRSQEEFGGAWSIATYIEAVETDDANIRKGLIDDIVKYNEEDLAATWAVFQWLKRQVS